MIPFAFSLQIGIDPAEGTSLFVSIHTVHCENALAGGRYSEESNYQDRSRFDVAIYNFNSFLATL